MAKRWQYKYGTNTITVVNKGLEGSELYINDVLRDQNNGLSLSDKLRGSLPSGETVSATLGGTFTVKCSLFINEELQNPIEGR